MHWLFCVGVFVATLFSHSEARCKFPGHRKNGNLKGDSLNRLEGSSLQLVCDKGYELTGTGKIVCKNGKYDGTLGTCEAVMCQPPKTSRLSISDPPSCLTGPTPYETHCVMSCPPGYPDRAVLYCNHEAKWEGRDVDCKDHEAPIIECPDQNDVSNVILLKTDPGKATATIRLPTLKYSDNSQQHGGKLDFSVTLNGKPISVQKEQKLSVSPFVIVRYLVRDEAGYSAECRLYYRVEDKELPKIENCPADIVTETAGNDNRVRVSWKEPLATDNSGDVDLFCDRPNGSEFYPGSSLVTYTATDKQGNEASCKFRVTVKLPCIDHSNFPIATILPEVTIPDPGNACSIPAADLQKCDLPVAKGRLPDDIVWKHICRKTCKAC